MNVPAQTFILPATQPREGMIARVATVLASLSPEKAWRVSIAEHKSLRSQQQNRYLWGVIYKTILEAGVLEGWDAEDLHEYLLGEWSGWEVLEGFGKKRMRAVRRSSALNRTEFGEFIDFIQRKMAEHGIYIADANPELAA
jgi:hypothetical protein